MASDIILRFAVMSDVHYNEKYPENRERFESAMKSVYKYSEKQPYSGLDALYVIGDFTDLGLPEQFEMFKADCDKCVRGDTKLVITLANHELHYYSDTESQKKFAELFKMELDRHEVINGYHFISLSTMQYQGKWHDSFDENKRKFLKDALESARKNNKGKPIFVFQHPGIPSTVEGGFFGNLELFGILKNYPEIVDFSGHSHSAVNDPREIDQRCFTSVSTGSLYNICQKHKNGLYAYVDRLMRKTTEYAHMLLVEVDADNRVYIKKLDVIAGDFFEDDYVLDNFGDPSAFKYTKARAGKAQAPYFDDNAALSVSRSDGKIDISFPAAHGRGERVKEYYISLSDSYGVFYQTVLASDYPGLHQNTKVDLTLDGLGREQFSVSVRAAGFWDNYSKEICSEVSYENN